MAGIEHQLKVHFCIPSFNVYDIGGCNSVAAIEVDLNNGMHKCTFNWCSIPAITATQGYARRSCKKCICSTCFPVMFDSRPAGSTIHPTLIHALSVEECLIPFHGIVLLIQLVALHLSLKRRFLRFIH